MGQKKKEKENENVETFIEKEEMIPEEIELSENEMLQFNLINTQFSLVKKSIENLEMQKQMYMMEHRTVVENYNTYKKEVGAKYSIEFEKYFVDTDLNKLILKKEEKQNPNQKFKK